MLDTKIARFRIDTSQETGEVILLIETQCGYRPVMGWPDVGSIKDFMEMPVEFLRQVYNSELIYT